MTGSKPGARDARVTWVQRTAFGLGMSAEAVASTVVNSFALFYYNQILGLPAALAGLAMTLGILLDGFIDPMIGSLSDRTHSRLGRRHPFILVAALPAAAGLVALFNPPPGLSTSALFVWLTVTIICLRIVVSIFQIPVLALGGELSTDYLERSKVMASGSLAAAIGMAVASFVALTVFLRATPQYPQGIFNRAGYLGLSISTAVAVLLLLGACILGTRQVRSHAAGPRPSAQGQAAATKALKDLAADFAIALRNRNYVFLLLGLFVISFVTGVRNSLTIYINTYFWGLTSEEIRWFAIWNLAAAIVCLMATGTLHHAIGKRFALVCSTITAGAFIAAPIAIKLMGWFPAKVNAAWLPLQLLFSAGATGAIAILSATALSALADIADEIDVRFGVRQEGVLYSARTFFSKVDTAVGALAAGWLLSAIGLKSGTTAASAPANAIALLALVSGPFVFVPAVIGAIFYGQFSITAKVHKAHREALQTRSPAPIGSGRNRSSLATD